MVEEPTEARRPRRRRTVKAIRHRAVDVGMVAQFDRFVAMSKEAGLAVQPQQASVRIAPPANRTRFLMYAAPEARDSGGGLRVWAGPQQFAEFFPHISEEKATDALGKYDDGFVAGEELDQRLDQIERFLTRRLSENSVLSDVRP